MRTILAALMAATLAQPAAALSCLQPSVASSFGHAQESPLTYVLATGRMTPLPGTARPVPRESLQVSSVQRARLDGHLASLSGFDRPISVPVQVETYCAGPWCGGVPEGEVLLFLEKRGDTYVLLEGPCPQFALTATPEALDEALACLRGEEDCGAP
ncbi:hypothetical protein [Jannaschia formosa]|uniref:hypothetical protein n=1 Tax=Jannaschia formosa TaxID=2259592 RepID=UPI000E1BA0E6|nr:hypothetical protein [Jannaschia formosa]TFL18384.1 hypothetical protein DR046_09845 [Jannaschia formosa]